MFFSIIIRFFLAEHDMVWYVFLSKLNEEGRDAHAKKNSGKGYNICDSDRG